MSTQFILNAHKKCIGQYNFQPLLYYNISGGYEYSFLLNQPGTYSIKYVSGAIRTFDYRFLKETGDLVNPDIAQDRIYWNKYYQSNLKKLGNYDITYFPTSSILLGCFQCQFGTLPGFTDLGYGSKELANTMNSYYLSNNNEQYLYTDKLTFKITQPQKLVFWYTSLAQQTVQGSIMYTIDTEINELEKTYYLNDISVLSINKNTNKKLTFENYSYNKQKENLVNEIGTSVQTVWLQNIQTLDIIKNISDFNTVGYSSAYLNNMIYSDTVNYNKKYSQIYEWQLLKNTQSRYKFIGKFTRNSPNLLLYKGMYSIFLDKLAWTTFDEYIVAQPQELFKSIKDNTYRVFSFSINNFEVIEFNRLLKYDDTAIYLYKGVIDLDQLNTYIEEMNNNVSFLQRETTDQDALNYIQQFTRSNSSVKIYNEVINLYYLDLYSYIQDNSLSTFYIYTSQKPLNNTSIGPYASVAEITGAMLGMQSMSGIILGSELIQTSGNYSTRSLQYILQPKVEK